MKIKERKINEKVRNDLIDTGMSPLLARIYAARQIESIEDIRIDIRDLTGFTQLKDIEKAAIRIADAIENDEKSICCGDFDADGANAAALVIEAITKMGGKPPLLFIPNRITQGYGLSRNLVEQMPEDTDLIITVDNGISSIDGVNAANTMGFDVIITDHHLPGEKLPDAYAIVNPNQPGCAFPWKGTAGVGVAFYVMGAVRAELRKRGWFTKMGIQELYMMELLDLVSLATVADVAPLERNNRIMVAEGLKRIRNKTCRPGITALFEVAKKDQSRVTAIDSGFIASPRLNAAGRLADMRVGVDLLLATDPEEARSIATTLDTLNRNRRDIEDDVRQIADAAAKEQMAQANGGGYSIVVYRPDWHEGVIGIVASRLREQYNRPTIVFTRAADGHLKGSGRSINALHLRDAIADVDVQHPGLIHKFGGHAAAAGLTIDASEESLATFQAAFEKAARKRLTPEDLQETIETDGLLKPVDFTMDNLRAIEDGGPWGRGFEPPLFHGKFRIFDVRHVASGGFKFKVTLGDKAIQCIWFRRGNEAHGDGPAPGSEVTFTYTPVINRFRGEENPEIMVQKMLNAGGGE
ncbi:MAG: single-stranded-DNA-specific exonuclease RecJ [Acidithiobacillus ferrivorans]